MNDQNLPTEQIQPSISAPSQTIPSPHGSSDMWSVFEHVLMFICLYIMSTALALLLHEFVNKWIPTTVPEYSIISLLFYSNQSDYALKACLASLIVAFPLFAYFYLNINKKTINNPIIRTIKIRKQLSYFTLIVIFIIVIKKIIEAIFVLLNSELSLNFLFHLIITVGVCGAIFIIYFHQVKEDRKLHA